MTLSTISGHRGTGFVGSHFTRAAVQAGRKVVVLDDQSGGEPMAHFAGKIQVGESVARPDVYFDVNVMRSHVPRRVRRRPAYPGSRLSWNQKSRCL